VGEVGRRIIFYSHYFDVFLQRKQKKYAMYMKIKFIIMLLLFPLFADCMIAGETKENRVPLKSTNGLNFPSRRSPQKKDICPTVVFYNDAHVLTLDNTDAEGDATYEICDVDGTLQYSGIVFAGESCEENLSTLSNGTYLIYVYVDGGVFYGTFDIL
jgi:hypothetical protein